MRTRLILICTLVLSSLHALAAAQPIVITDLFGDLDVRGEADALSLLLQAGFDDPSRPVVSRGELRRAIEAMTGVNAHYALSVDPGRRLGLLQQLKASHLVYGALKRSGVGLTAQLGIVTTEAQHVTSISVIEPHSDVGELAGLIAQKISALIGPPAPNISRTSSLGQLLPYVSASDALLNNAPQRAAAALQTADPFALASFNVAREIARTVGGARNVKTEDRLLAAVIARDFKTGFELARQSSDEGLRRSVEAYAALSRGEPSAAESALGKLRGDLPRLGLLARAEILHRRGQQKLRDEILRRLLQAPPYVPALVRIACLAPPSITPELLGASLRALESLGEPERYAGLATALALRAVMAGGAGRQPLAKTLAYIKVELLTEQELAYLSPLVDEAVRAGLPVGFRLRAELALRVGKHQQAIADLRVAVQRDSADARSRLLLGRLLVETRDYPGAITQLALAARDGQAGTRLEYARALAQAGRTSEATALYRTLDTEQAEEVPPTLASLRHLENEAEQRALQAAKLSLEDEQLKALESELQAFISAFPPLTDAQYSIVTLAPLAGSSEAFYWPFEVHPDVLRLALLRALDRPQYALTVQEAFDPVARLTATSLDELAAQSRSDGVLLYGLRATLGGRARISLIYFGRGQRGALEYTQTINGKRLGLVHWNTLWVFGSLGLVLLLVAWGGFVFWRGVGEIGVKIEFDPAMSHHAFTLLVSRRAKPPRVKNPTQYAARMEREGARTSRYVATRVYGSTRFERIPPGRYYVHLFGTFTKEGRLQQLPVGFSEEVRLGRGESASVVFSLVPSVSELRVSVFDDQRPVTGAIVWLNKDANQTMLTDLHGQLVLRVPRNKQNIVHIKHGETEVQRAVQITDTKTHALSVNLAKERQLADLDQGIPVAERWAAAASQPAQEGVSGEGPTAPSVPTVQATAPLRAKPETAGAPAAAPAPAGGLQEPPTGGLQRFQTLHELGRGAMGVVYKARDRILERDVALKVIGEELRQFPLALQMFQQEAKALAALSHPNIVTVYDQGSDGASTYIVMEFIEGTTLERIIQSEGHLSLPQGLDVADQLCAGMSYAHARKILHRDIKPENIFLSHDGVVKIGDFGLARALREMAIQRTEIRGTPLYMAPEQIQGKDIDFRADIYALGCTLFAIFTGRPPFVAGEILYHHLHTPPPRPSEIVSTLPAELDAIIVRCLAKDKDGRPSAATEVREALRPLHARFM